MTEARAEAMLCSGRWSLQRRVEIKWSFLCHTSFWFHLIYLDQHVHRETRYFPANLLIPRIEATVKHRLSQTGPTKDPWTSIVLNVQTLIRGQVFTGLTSVLRERFGTFSSQLPNGILEPYLSQRCHVQIKYRAQQISNVDADPHPRPSLPPSLLLSVFPFPRLRWR